ncbi:MAG: FtsX-like permease family protein [Candidatus Latescibacteria bacterium]|nr:FtsX-like permease family protein [Candidatus Latescibacterota bacterium]
MTYETLIARRYLRSIRGRGRISVTAWIAVFGVALGVAALIIVLSVMNGFAGVVRDRLLGVNAHITIRKVYGARIPDYARVTKAVAGADPAILGASPFVQSEGMLCAKERIAGAIIRGLDPASLGTVSDLMHYTDEKTLDLKDRMVEGRPVGGMAIGRYLADRLGVEPGGEVFLLVPEFSSVGAPVTPRYWRFIVTGIFNTGYYEFDSGLVIVSIQAAQRILGWGDEVSGIRVKVRDPLDADAVARAIRSTLQPIDAGLYAASWVRENGNLFVWIRLEKWFSFLALSLIVLVASFNIMSILSMIVMDKRREIGILKTMGATRKSLQRIFTRIGLIIGLSGVALGDLIGFTLCYLQQRYELIALPGDVYIISALPVDMHAADFGAISGIALVICYLMARFPARSAAALEPVEAIRYE